MQSNQGKNGNLHTRYQQTYKGIPVWGNRLLSTEIRMAK
ncbi:hypothetical protein ACVT98_16580 [Vibrio campbellii]